MNRTRKIIVGVFSALLVLVAIIGITYAYFVARVQGNTNTVSISTKAGILSLVYGEGQNDVIEATNILPGYTNTKNFTVTNNGSGTASYGVFLEELRNTFTRNEDLKLTITCTSNVENKECNGLAQSNFPIQNDLLITNSIDKDEIQTYTLTLEYLNANENQNADNNASLFAKVQIYDLDSTVDLEGTVTNSQPGDYVVVNSSPKRSEIVNGTFKVVGLEPDNHTINIYNESNTTTPKSTSTLTINSGTEESISGTIVTIVESSRTITTSVNATSNNSIIANDIEQINSNTGDGNNNIPNPFVGETTLAYNIFNNALNVTEAQKSLLYAEYSEIPKTTPAVEASGENESTLSKAEDENNTYSYYFRGNVANNYVNFAGICWRIVRIDGNGNIKLLLEDQDQPCSNSNGNWDIPTVTGGSTKKGNFGYTYSSGYIYLASYLSPETDANNSQVVAYENFQTNILNSNIQNIYNNATLSTYLNNHDWCYDDKAYTTNDGTGTLISDKNTYYTNNKTFYYSSDIRLYGLNENNYPTYECSGTLLNTYSDTTPMYVGALTADEIVYAGGRTLTGNNYYIVNDYLKSSNSYFWTMSLSLFTSSKEYAYAVSNDGYLIRKNNYTSVKDARKNLFRPTISLVSGVEIESGGDGSQSNPYVIQ